ncbi:uncharacterized protein LOC128256753 [Drosophila gunungcola]|uniref:Uncharacterized protein n=1 Tax=Drosophila gunungcola TaxID=103775 RepID=A0A9P9YFN7_9MUSC|nr:uncharacterized protein LOC128256753 [Drosophila gunungcola]KAI8035938.1 hypothetical protein M5D96_011369 [Drosophila gunungcola]
MWEQLERYRNHFLQNEIKDVLKPSSINRQQNKEWSKAMEKRHICKCMPYGCSSTSTHLQDRAQLAYGWFALPKLVKELDSDVPLTHWKAVVSLTEFLSNPLNAQRAITEKDIVRKLKNAFMRMRLKLHKEQYREVEMYLKIYNILSRNLDGAEHIANRKCLRNEFYKIIKNQEANKDGLASEILRNLTGKPKVLGIFMEDPENFAALAEIFNQDPCRPHYPLDLWHHLCHLLEVAPEQAIALGFFELLHQRILNRLADFWDMATKAFALLLRCAEGQRHFNAVDGVKLLYDIFAQPDEEKPSMLLPQQKVQNWEYTVLALLNGLHSKRALWRSREFTQLPCYVGRLMESAMAATVANPRLQLYCLKALRELGVMPCTKRYIVANWLADICQLFCLDAEAECARDSLVDWLRRDIADSS